MSKYIIASIIFIFASTGIAYAGNESQGYEDVQPTIINPCDGGCEVTPTVEATVTPTVSIEATLTPTKGDNEVTPTPTATPSNGGTGKGDGKSDNMSDGKSDGSCSKPPCVTPGVVIPEGPPSTGRGE